MTILLPNSDRNSINSHPVVGYGYSELDGLCFSFNAENPYANRLHNGALYSGFEQTPWGRGLKVVATDGTYLTAKLDRPINVSEITMMWYGYVNAFTAYSDLFAVGNGTNDIVLELQINPQYSPSIYPIGYGGTGANGSGSYYLNNSISCIVVRASSSLDISEVFVNGVSIGTGTGWAGTSGTATYATIANRSVPTGGRTGGGHHMVAHAWNRYLTNVEVSNLGKNPRLLFSQPPKVQPIPTASPTGNKLISLPAGYVKTSDETWNAFNHDAPVRPSVSLVKNTSIGFNDSFKIKDPRVINIPWVISRPIGGVWQSEVPYSEAASFQTLYNNPAVLTGSTYGSVLRTSTYSNVARTWNFPSTPRYFIAIACIIPSSLGTAVEIGNLDIGGIRSLFITVNTNGTVTPKYRNSSWSLESGSAVIVPNNVPITVVLTYYANTVELFVNGKSKTTFIGAYGVGTTDIYHKHDGKPEIPSFWQASGFSSSKMPDFTGFCAYSPWDIFEVPKDKVQPFPQPRPFIKTTRKYSLARTTQPQLIIDSNRNVTDILSASTSVATFTNPASVGIGLDGIAWKAVEGYLIDVNSKDWVPINTQKGTIIFRAKINTLATWGVIFQKFNATVWRFLLQRYTTADQLVFNIPGAAVQFVGFSINSIVGDNKYHTFVITLENVGTALTRPYLYVDGIKYSASGNLAAWMPTDVNGVFSVGSSDLTYTSNLEISMYCYINGNILSDEDVRDISPNVWQLFGDRTVQHPSTSVITDDGIIIPPYLSQPQAINVTSTTATPKVKVDY